MKRAALSLALRDAARLVARVVAGTSLAETLGPAADATRSSRAALIDLTHGVLRRYGRMQALVRHLSHREPPDALLQSLLWCAIYALERARHAEYTVVDQAVVAAGLLERGNARGYVNGLLRSYLRRRASLEAKLRTDPEAHYQHPGWWIRLVQQAQPQYWEGVLAAGNTHPPMCIRVNRRRADREEYQATLAREGLAARPIGGDGLLLERPVPVQRLPGFSAGEISVQDAGAQRAAHCLDLAPGMRVLDACAAPGGKAAHILEHEDVSLLALDADSARARRVRDTFERLGLAGTVQVADCTCPEQWWDGVPFDRILADVPCTASGVVRRHPDLKWLRRAGDVAQFAARQGSILCALWPLLRPGGKLLYVTCSVFRQENEEVVAAFAAQMPDACCLPMPDGAPWAWLPNDEHDGFFYSLMQKRA